MNPGEVKVMEEQQCKGFKMILETPKGLDRQLGACYRWQISQLHNLGTICIWFTGTGRELGNWDYNGINHMTPGIPFILLLKGPRAALHCLSCIWEVIWGLLGQEYQVGRREQIKVCWFSTQSQPLSKLCDHEPRLRTVVNLKSQPRAENLWDLMLLIPPALTFTRSDC